MRRLAARSLREAGYRVNGRQLHDAVHARWPELPVLFTSGHTGEAGVLERLVPAGAAFLGKPFTPERLRSAVDGLLAASQAPHA